MPTKTERGRRTGSSRKKHKKPKQAIKRGGKYVKRVTRTPEGGETISQKKPETPEHQNIYVIGGYFKLQAQSSFGRASLQKELSYAKLRKGLEEDVSEQFLVFDTATKAIKALPFLIAYEAGSGLETYASGMGIYAPAIYQLEVDGESWRKFKAFNSEQVKVDSYFEFDGKCYVSKKNDKAKKDRTYLQDTMKLAPKEVIKKNLHKLQGIWYEYQGETKTLDTDNFHKCWQPHHLKSYDKKYDGLPKVYHSKLLFKDTFAMLSGKRKLFANTRAWWRGEGHLCADTRALFKRGLFANTRNGLKALVGRGKLPSCDKHAHVVKPN